MRYDWTDLFKNSYFRFDEFNNGFNQLCQFIFSSYLELLKQENKFLQTNMIMKQRKNITKINMNLNLLSDGKVG